MTRYFNIFFCFSRRGRLLSTQRPNNQIFKMCGHTRSARLICFLLLQDFIRSELETWMFLLSCLKSSFKFSFLWIKSDSTALGKDTHVGKNSKHVLFWSSKKRLHIISISLKSSTSSSLTLLCFHCVSVLLFNIVASSFNDLEFK